MRRPVLLDLYCGAGGAGMGYHRAGWEVVGVDIEPQPRYPFEFHQGDALDLIDELVRRYRPAAIHASPPCQDHTTASGGRTHGTGWLLPATIDHLKALGLPYAVENVPGAAAMMAGAATLCGRAFGISRLRRHRLFLASVPLLVPPCACSRRVQPIGVYGDLRVNDRRDRGTHGSVRIRAGVQTARDLLGCPWMTGPELSQAIPPVYTEFIGGQLLASLSAVADA